MPRIELTAEGLSSFRLGSAALIAAFQEFLATMVEVGGPAYRFEEMLHPGLEEREIRNRFAEHGIDPPDELVTYWTLHNGLIAERSAQPPLPLWQAASLELCLDMWERRRRLWREDAVYDPEFPVADARWFELTGDYPLVAAITQSANGGCQVRRIYPDEFGFADGPEYRFTSICTIFDLMSEGIRTGQISQNSEPGSRVENSWDYGVDALAWHKFTHGSHVV